MSVIESWPVSRMTDPFTWAMHVLKRQMLSLQLTVHFTRKWPATTEEKYMNFLLKGDVTRQSVFTVSRSSKWKKCKLDGGTRKDYSISGSFECFHNFQLCGRPCVPQAALEQYFLHVLSVEIHGAKLIWACGKHCLTEEETNIQGRGNQKVSFTVKNDISLYLHDCFAMLELCS